MSEQRGERGGVMKCPDCGGIVSYSAKACPHCGNRILRTMSKNEILVKLVLIRIGIVLCAGLVIWGIYKVLQGLHVI